MKSNRRDFLRTAAAVGAGAVSGGIITGCTGGSQKTEYLPEIRKATSFDYHQRFNMSGYRAPAMEKVRIGVIGLGDRGGDAVQRLVQIEGVEITALADLRQAAVDFSVIFLKEAGLPVPQLFSGDDFSWKGLCDLDNVDLVYICTPWVWHTPMAVYAMEAGKHVAVEVPAARTVEEAWQLVETSERTKKHCMQLENCCYDDFELLTLNMARNGLFGDIVHGEGAYIHNLMGYNFRKPTDEKQSDGAYTGMWRLKENAERNGNLYPTHGLGPVCQVMNINRGDRMDYLTSLSTADFTMGKHADKLALEDEFYQPYSGRKYRGNMNTTLIKTSLGRSIMIQHDVSSVRPYSRIHLISGTLGAAQRWPMPERIALGHSWLKDAEMAEIWNRYTPQIMKRVGALAKVVGGHGGMDFIMDWRLIDCLRNGLPLDQDVYDAALWSSISPLSEWSVANRSSSIDVPDFTCGSWKTNSPVDIELAEGGNTRVLLIESPEEAEQMKV